MKILYAILLFAAAAGVLMLSLHLAPMADCYQCEDGFSEHDGFTMCEGIKLLAWVVAVILSIGAICCIWDSIPWKPDNTDVKEEKGAANGSTG